MRNGEHVTVEFKRADDGRTYSATGVIERVLSADSCAVYWEHYDADNRFTERYTRVFTAEELYGTHHQISLSV